MKLIGAIIVLACLAEIAMTWDFISKDCCEPHDDEHLGRICDDGSRAPLVGCCGNGPCNVMCCNCDNGCKSGPHKPVKLLGVWSADIKPNLGFSGGSSAASGGEFVKEAMKTAGAHVGKGAWAVATKKKDNESSSGIEYHKWH